ncbi:MAG: hypothetical protein WCP06_10440 [Verrucomicrobiota bacterium]
MSLEDLRKYPVYGKRSLVAALGGKQFWMTWASTFPASRPRPGVEITIEPNANTSIRKIAFP